MKSSKEKAYNTKIEFIESEAVLYGETNMEYLRKGIDFTTNKTSICEFSEGENPAVTYTTNLTYSDDLLNGRNNTYLCIRFKVNNSNCNSSNKNAYDKQIINTTTNNIINSCNVYVYYKNNRAYAYFDKLTCNHVTNDPNEANTYGYEYKSIVWSK